MKRRWEFKKKGGDNEGLAAKWRVLGIERGYGQAYEVLWTLLEYFDLPVNGKKKQEEERK